MAMHARKNVLILRTAHSKRLTSHKSIGNLSAAHAFNYIVLRVKPGLTSCKDLATALAILEPHNFLFGNDWRLKTRFLPTLCLPQEHNGTNIADALLRTHEIM